MGNHVVPAWGQVLKNNTGPAVHRWLRGAPHGHAACMRMQMVQDSRARPLQCLADADVRYFKTKKSSVGHPQDVECHG